MNSLSQRVLAALATLLLAALPVRAQVVRLGGGASTIADTDGATVTVYQADATTQTSLGYAQGLHLGGSREVRNSAAYLAVGDGAISLDLPTDLAGGGRAMSVRGVLTGTLDERRAALASADNLVGSTDRPRISSTAFAGWTGDGYRNAFFSSIAPTHAIAFATARLTLTKALDLSAIAVRGSQSSMLASAAWRMQPHTMAAMTLGFSGGKPMLRLAAHSSGATWHMQGNYSSTALHLQPEPTLASLSLERVGWNIMASKRVGNWLFVDAARHEFATSDAADSSSAGISAGRSTLYEAGATLHMGHADAGGRVLQSISGVLKSGGFVMIAGWNAKRWNVRGTSVQNVDPFGVTTRSATVDTTERTNGRLQLTQGTSFANGAPSVDFGGAFENRLVALTVSHRETYVPFGHQAGFHRVLAVGVRLHIGSSELAADAIRGGGLKSSYEVSIDSFQGDSLGAPGGGPSHMASVPRYAVRGRVLTTEGTPVRGAAVAAGSQTVYTDSEGRFFARFSRATVVRVAVMPAAFLTAESYRSAGGTRLAEPRPEASAEDIELQVERCNACDAGDIPLNARMTDDDPMEIHRKQKPRSALVRAGLGMFQLSKRMFLLRPARGTAA